MEDKDAQSERRKANGEKAESRRSDSQKETLIDIRIVTEEDTQKDPVECLKNIRKMRPGDTVVLYHGASLESLFAKVRGEKMGIGQNKRWGRGEVFDNPTLSLVPVGGYWGPGRVGVIYSIPRREVALCDESRKGKQVVVDKDGIAGMVGKNPYLSLLDVEGEIAVYEGTTLNPQEIDQIKKINAWTSQARERLSEPKARLQTFWVQCSGESFPGLADEERTLIDEPFYTNRVIDGSFQKAISRINASAEQLISDLNSENRETNNELEEISKNLKGLRNATKKAEEKPNIISRLLGRKKKVLVLLRLAVQKSRDLIAQKDGLQPEKVETGSDILDKAYEEERMLEIVRESVAERAKKIAEKIQFYTSIKSQVPEVTQAIEEYDLRYRELYSSTEKSSEGFQEPLKAEAGKPPIPIALKKFEIEGQGILIPDYYEGFFKPVWGEIASAFCRRLETQKDTFMNSVPITSIRELPDYLIINGIEYRARELYKDEVAAYLPVENALGQPEICFTNDSIFGHELHLRQRVMIPGCSEGYGYRWESWQLSPRPDQDGFIIKPKPSLHHLKIPRMGFVLPGLDCTPYSYLRVRADYYEGYGSQVTVPKFVTLLLEKEEEKLAESRSSLSVCTLILNKDTLEGTVNRSRIKLAVFEDPKVTPDSVVQLLLLMTKGITGIDFVVKK